MFCMLLFQLLPLPNSYPISPDDAENMQSSKNRVSGLLDYEILKFSEILAVVWIFLFQTIQKILFHLTDESRIFKLKV